MSVALLIIGYREPQVLRSAISIYRAAGLDIFLHLDAKVDLDQYVAQLGEEATYCKIISRRVPVFWGGFSMIEAQLALINTALDTQDYDNYCLISDDSYPLLNSAGLKAYFACDLDRVSIRKVDEADLFMSRYRDYFFLDHPASSLLGRPIESAYIDETFLDNMHRVTKLKISGKKVFEIYYGSQWWSISRGSMQVVLKQIKSDSLMLESFRYSAVPDEMLFQTLIGNYCSREKLRQGPVFVDWSKEPRPYIFRSREDLRSISEAFPFARKFSAKVAHAYEMLGRELKVTV